MYCIYCKKKLYVHRVKTDLLISDLPNNEIYIDYKHTLNAVIYT